MSVRPGDRVLDDVRLRSEEVSVLVDAAVVGERDLDTALDGSD